MCSSNPLAVNSRDKHSRTPLHLAAWSGQSEVVSYLCKNKADVGAAAMDDMGAIHFASQKGHLEVVRVLLSLGVSVKAANRKGLTPLHYAVRGSHLELVKYLVRKGASLSAKTKAGETPLDLATSDEVRSLLVECEQSSKKGEQLTGSKTENESEEKKNTPNEREDVNKPVREEPANKRDGVGSDREQVAKEAKEEQRDDERDKRKVQESETGESLSRPKKAKVALGHLLAGNDMQEDEEE